MSLPIREPLGILAANPAELRILRRAVVASILSGAATALLVPIVVEKVKTMGFSFQITGRFLKLVAYRPTLILEEPLLKRLYQVT